MILWQFIALIAVLIVRELAAETRHNKRNKKLDALLLALSEIESRLAPINDLPADIARAIYREGESRRENFLTTGKEEL